MLRFRFTRCLFFSRYATARRRILSFIPRSPLALSLALCVVLLLSPPPRSVIRVRAYVPASVCACTCARARARSASLGAAARFEAQLPHAALSYRRYRDVALCAIVAVLFMSGEGIVHARKSARESRRSRTPDAAATTTVMIIGFPCDSQCNCGGKCGETQ